MVENNCCPLILMLVLNRLSLGSPMFRAPELHSFHSEARSYTIHAFPPVLEAASRLPVDSFLA